MYSLMVATVSLGLTGGIAHGQGRAAERNSRDSRASERNSQGRAAERDELESRALTVNALADQRGGMREAIHDVSVETGVPLEKLQRMRDQHPDAGAAGLMIACVLADNAKGDPEGYLSRHVNGKGWGAIARDNNVPLEKINDRLALLERDLKRGASGQLPATGRDNTTRNRRY
jgi:hypothetical protein